MIRYVVCDLMEVDLLSILKSKQKITDQFIQYWIYNVLRGLKYIHSRQVIHRDIKPANILLNKNDDVKICDFGLARSIIGDTKKPGSVLTDYIVTRWYRAPELLLGSKEYGYAVDVWSVGCILAELIGRKPFLQGDCTNKQLKLVIDVVGTPTEAEIAKITEPNAKKKLKSIPTRQPMRLTENFPEANP